MNEHHHPRPSELASAFLEDHRILTRGLEAIRDAVATKDLARARLLADRLDREAGPHIAFEERYFYPSLERFLGRDEVHRLYEEHRAGLAAIRSLRSAAEDADLDPVELEAQLKTMADHALSCGTLTSHTESLDEPERRALLTHLRELRTTAGRWTDIEIEG